MKKLVGVLMTVVVLGARGGRLNSGFCSNQRCVTLHTEQLDFSSARDSCLRRGGSLLIVIAVLDRVTSELLTGSRGDFWIASNCTKICPDSSRESTHCCPRCGALSGSAQRSERPCNVPAEGFLCQYNNTNTCGRLLLDSSVVYETPFGFSSEALDEVPHSSNASRVDLGTKHICLDGTWFEAPWNCEVYRGGCEHDCAQRNNKYICTCRSGYRLGSNGVSCQKGAVDPCLRAGCSQRCTAKGDKHVCSCHAGFKLAKDGRSCEDIRDCSDKGVCPGEHSRCVNTSSGYECHCASGFKKVNGACEDENECESGPCEQECNNTIGSYHCVCWEGYKVSPEDRHKCVLHCPQSECPAVDCDPNSPFQCSCPSGFILEERPSGLYCVDIDECEMFYCDQKCENVAGSYICSCNEGFNLVGTNCVDTLGLLTTLSSVFTPTSGFPSEEPPSLPPSCLIGITVCTVIGILIVVCLVHHIMKHHGKNCFCVDRNHSEDTNGLQQVTTENYTKECPVTSNKSSKF